MTQDNLTKKKLLLIIDGHSIVYRAWHGIKFPMTFPGTSDPIHGVYGFTSQILNAINKLKENLHAYVKKTYNCNTENVNYKNQISKITAKRKQPQAQTTAERPAPC